MKTNWIIAKYFLKSFICAALTSAFYLHAEAAIHTESVEYKHGDVILEGFLAYDDAITGKRPGVLIAHEWSGLGDYVKSRAEKLAKIGYIAFALDIFGKNNRPQDSQEAKEKAEYFYSDRQLLRARANAGLEQLKKNGLVDKDNIAVIGYCFGGTTVLELARSGTDIAAVVSFHGGLNTPTPEDAKNIKAKVLALHGANDPFVPISDVENFQKEMRDAGVDWQMIIYGNAVHSFSNPDSGNDPSKGAAYNEKADKRSWEAMLSLFKEIFPQ